MYIYIYVYLRAHIIASCMHPDMHAQKHKRTCRGVAVHARCMHLDYVGDPYLGNGPRSGILEGDGEPVHLIEIFLKAFLISVIGDENDLELFSSVFELPHGVHQLGCKALAGRAPRSTEVDADRLAG